MPYTTLPTRTSANANSAADINQLMENIELLAGNSGTVPDATIQEVYNNIQCLFYPSYQNLTAKPNTSNPNYQVDVAWDELRIENRRTTSKSFTVDITQSGALGLSTGSEAVSTWYAIWAGCNDAGTSVTAWLDPSFTSPTLPSGYTKKRLISAVYNDASGNCRGFLQQNETYEYTAEYIALAENVAGTTPVEYSLVTHMPECSHKIHLLVFTANSGASNSMDLHAWIAGAYKQYKYYLYDAYTQTGDVSVFTTYGQKLKANVTSGYGGTYYIRVLGFELNL